VDWSPSSGLYLWVLEQNGNARDFYAARGGACVERAETPPPGGDPARLNGKPMGLRYAWRDPSKLLLSSRHHQPACHYHPYELAPTAAELTSWLDQAAHLITQLHAASTAPAPPRH
jgi:hypothetical protein